MADSKDMLAFGSARAYRLAEEDESARLMYQVPRPLCVPRVLPPAQPLPERTLEELVADAEQIRRVHLWYRFGDGTHCPHCGGELEWRWGVGRYCRKCNIAF